MPGFKYQAKVLFRTLRVQCALGVFAILLLSHVSARAQSHPRVPGGWKPMAAVSPTSLIPIPTQPTGRCRLTPRNGSR